jgi:hypothetical protein
MMLLPSTTRLRLTLLLAALNLLPRLAQAQSAEYSCPDFFHLHQAVDCIEAIFSEDTAPLYTHFTVGSVPPSNGFALGLITEDPTHFVSAFAPHISPDMRDPDIFVVPSDVSDPSKTDSGGHKSLFVPRIGEAVSTNGSWYVTGGFDWMPGLYVPGFTLVPPLAPGLPKTRHNCHQLGKLCTDSVLTLHFDTGHSVARTIDFYGLGPASPNRQYTFRLDQTFGSLQDRLPLLDYHTAATSNEFAVAAGIEFRRLQLPVQSLPASVYTNFTTATLPGLTGEPTYLHSNVGFLDNLTHVSEQKLKPGQAPLLKRYDAVTLLSSFSYHWYTDTGFSGASFQREVADADLSVELGARIQKHVVSTPAPPFWRDLYYRFLSARCGGRPADPRIDTNPKADTTARKAASDQAAAYLKQNGYRYELKKTDLCDFGDLTLATHLAASHAPAGNVIPFFMRPTVGGQDIDSLTSLRGFANYRFRGNDATFVQTSYTLPIYDPLGLLVFYDAGNAGDTLGALSFAHLHQDAGFGVNIHIMRVSYAQAYLAWGAGSGPYLGYNLVKQF